ncbi:MAG TPA: hypothetical protein VMU50_14500 [Polyangia bacterium]|nr:hypothetical protein [Polyangia bacterium]
MRSFFRGIGLRRCVAAVALLPVLWVLRPAPARAYDPATTHAGLTERAVLASKLNHILASRLGKPLGLFETVGFDLSQLPRPEARRLKERLFALDPAQGYRPSDDGSATALSWVVAGAVLSGTPAERARHTFFDPARQRGLQQGRGAIAFGNAVRQFLDEGGSPRGLATGSSFDLTGQPAPEWLLSPENDVGLAVFYDQWEQAVAAAEPAARAAALARALLALGGTLAVLEDAGEPAHVRNDFTDAYLDGGSGVFDRSSAYERFVAETYGRGGVPAPGPAIDRPNVRAFFSAPDAQGLADRTQRRFFSPGSLPDDAVVERDTSAHDVLLQARESLPYGWPRLPRLQLRAIGRLEYARSSDGIEMLGGHPRRLLAYTRVPGRVRFFLDSAVYADSARVLLPEIGAYAAGLVDHLFRAELSLAVSGGTVTMTIAGPRGSLRNARCQMFAEDQVGHRVVIATRPCNLDAPLSASVPPGTRRVAATLRGEDDAGPLVANAESLVH